MKPSPILRKIQELQGDTPWGHVLDAGTGVKSLSWVSSLETERWTAVTAQPSFIEGISSALPTEPREQDRVLLGNWADDKFLRGEQFDTVLLDYLIGAVDAFAPYFQSSLLERLMSCARGCVYIIGLEPYVPVVADDEVGKFVGDLGRLRDACMLLARNRPYREYPAPWVQSQLTRSGFTVTDVKFFKIRYRRNFVTSQLTICKEQLKRLEDQKLATALNLHIDEMQKRGEALIEANDGLPYGRDYVIRATRSP